MDGNKLDSDSLPPMPPPHGAPQPQGVPQPAQGPTSQPRGAEQPWAAPVNWAPPASAPESKPRRRSKLLMVLVGLAVLSVASIVFVAVAVVVATSTGLFDSDQSDTDASAQLEQPAATAGVDSDEDDGNDQPAAAVPIAPEGLIITWDASPSSCDGNNKRSFSATVGHAAPEALDVRVRVLDSGNNLVHQSHVYTVPAAGQAQVDLGGIPSGQSIVQIVTESNDMAIGQTDMTFENC